MVYGLMADLHLHRWSAFSEVMPDGQNSRLVGLLTEIERCAKEVSELGGKHVVIAGDVFHVRGSVAPSVGNSIADILWGCAESYGVEFIILAGNHDLEGKEATRLGSAITALEDGHVRVVNEPWYSGKDLRVVMVPWIEDIEALKATIDKLGTGTMDKFFRENTDLILHAPIDGVITGIPDHGLRPEWLADLGFKRVFAGHYHNHRIFPGGVYSIGALAHHSWNDIDSKAGYLLVHDDRVDWRKSHLPEFIDLAQLTEVDPEDIPLLVDGNFVRCRVEAEKHKEVEAAKKELLDMGARAVLVQTMPKANVREGSAIASIASGASLEVSVKDFVEGMKLGENSEAVLRAAIDVLANVAEA